MSDRPPPWDFFTEAPAALPPADDSDIDVALDDPEPDAIPREFTYDTDPQR